MVADLLPLPDPPLYVISEREFRFRRTAGYIDHATRVNRRPPSLREIGRRFGIGRSSMFRRFECMEALGFVARGSHRSMRTLHVLSGPPLGSIPQPPSTPPTRRRPLR